MKFLLAAVTMSTILADPRYWPPDHPHGCTSVCHLHGLGGVVSIWEGWVDKHRSATFVVSGVCASACEIAVRRAQRNGSKVIIRPGSRLIKHRPSRAKWR